MAVREFNSLITLTQVSDGAPGTQGAPGASLEVKYISSETVPEIGDLSNWSDTMPDQEIGKTIYMIQRVGDGEWTTPIQISAEDGQDGKGYYVETNAENVLSFLTSNEIEVSPSTLEISVYKTPRTNETQREQLSDGIASDTTPNFKFGYIGQNGSFVSLIDEKKEEEEEKEEENKKSYKTYYSVGKEENQESILYYNIGGLANSKDATTGRALLPRNVVLVFTYLKDNEEVAIKAIPFQDGTSLQMAKFEVTARSINASVEKSKMSFEEDGLKIFGTGLTIYNNNTENKKAMLIADNDGNLQFSGTLEGANGNFSGTITAQEGKIGGFNINSTTLESTERTDGGTPSLILDGKGGKITAKNIEIGNEAKIIEFIKLGGEDSDTYIYNPDSDASKRFLKSGEITIYNKGIASFGNITIDGPNSKIYGTNFSITPDLSSFSNVTVSGAIKTSVFETETTQAVGGAMIFLPSYKIKLKTTELENEDETAEIIFDDDGTPWTENDCKIADGSKVWLVDSSNSYKEITVIVDKENKKISTKQVIGSFSPISLINIGVVSSDGLKPLIMGINSGDTKTANNHLTPRGLTITEYGKTEEPNLFLGDLSKIGTKYSGYGLYADNVYLKGSLTTESSGTNTSYAGVNTLSAVEANIFKNFTDNSNIIFWAGAPNTTTGGIQSAPFQVTEKGSIYASRAELTDSVFVEGTIEGADIYAARIHGWDSSADELAALTIYDTDKGIAFKSGYGKDNEVETFTIGLNGFKVADKSFIEIEEDGVVFDGKRLKISGDSNYLSLEREVGIPVLKHVYNSENNCGFYFGEKETTYKINDALKTIWSTTDTKILGNISFAQGKDDTKFQYRPVDGEGYDLYIIYE